MKKFNIIKYYGFDRRNFFADTDWNNENALLKTADELAEDLKRNCAENEFICEVDGVLECSCGNHNKVRVSWEKDKDDWYLDDDGKTQYLIHVDCCQKNAVVPISPEDFWEEVKNALYEKIKSKSLRCPGRNYLSHVLRFIVKIESDGEESWLVVV